MTKQSTVIGASLAAMIAGAAFPKALAAEVAAAAKARKPALPTVVVIAGILRKFEGLAHAKRAAWSDATRAKIRTARQMAANEAAALGYVA